MCKIKEYQETHQQGIISIEQVLPTGIIQGDIGIQISKDGRIWVCIDGAVFIRFRPSKAIIVKQLENVQ